MWIPTDNITENELETRAKYKGVTDTRVATYYLDAEKRLIGHTSELGACIYDGPKRAGMYLERMHLIQINA